MNAPDAVHGDELPDDAVHEVLHDGVRDVFASADLGERIVSAAKRRRAARLSVTSAIAVVALAGTIGTYAEERSGGIAGSTATAELPLTCAANVAWYASSASSEAQGPASVHLVPPMPGSPDGAALCRYTGLGEAHPVGALAGTAAVTDPVQLAQLQRAMNSVGAQRQGSADGCGIDNEEIAIVLIRYPDPPALRVVRYERWCYLLIGESTAQYASGGFDQLVTAWTGDWQPTASIPGR